MSFSSVRDFLTSVSARARRAPRRRPTLGTRLGVEALEDRCLLSNFTTGPLVQVSVTDPFAGSTADHPASQPGTFVPDSEIEPMVVVDPTNPNHLAGIWQQDRWSGQGSRGVVLGVSFDGGQSWQEVVPPGLSLVAGGPFQRASDEWLSFAPNGDLYLSALSLNASATAPFGENTVMASKSTDGGLTWSNPVTVTDNTTAFNDKDAITADPSNPQVAYLVWHQSSAVLFSRTTDGGQTWEPARVIYDAAPFYDTLVDTRPVQILVEPDGALVGFFSESRVSVAIPAMPLPGPSKLIILRSTDQGETWQGPIQIGMMKDVGVTDPDTGRSLAIGRKFYQAAVDPHNGNLYAVWRDARFSQGQHDSIAFSMSTDGGLTWSEPIQINQTPTDLPDGEQQAFLPSIAVGKNGTVAVTYYDLRFNDPSPGLATDYWLVRGNPHGRGGLTDPANWGDELRLTDSSFDMEKAPSTRGRGQSLGDYEGLAAVRNSFVTFFAQPHGTDPASVFFRQIKPGDEGHHRGHGQDPGEQSPGAFLAPAMPILQRTVWSAPAAPTASTLGFALATPVDDGSLLGAGDSIPIPATTTPGDVKCLDQLFVAGLEDETSFVLPKSRRDPWNFADDLGVDLLS
jgi:hypothetical protein